MSSGPMSSGEGDAVVQSSSAMAAAYSGPLPPPEWLGQYEQVLPGIADRMYDEASEAHTMPRPTERAQMSAIQPGPRPGPGHLELVRLADPPDPARTPAPDRPGICFDWPARLSPMRYVVRHGK